MVRRENRDQGKGCSVFLFYWKHCGGERIIGGEEEEEKQHQMYKKPLVFLFFFAGTLVFLLSIAKL